jgi:hypothetical protein
MRTAVSRAALVRVSECQLNLHNGIDTKHFCFGWCVVCPQCDARKRWRRPPPIAEGVRLTG